ncbi:MAG: VCBS repeat-containing protein [Deltaproteobacteria bacterium]|nr:VCBS repeat-containing protein [Deltaproteobacteria bacterium]
MSTSSVGCGAPDDATEDTASQAATASRETATQEDGAEASEENARAGRPPFRPRPSFPAALGDACAFPPVSPPPQENVGATVGEAGVSGGTASYRIPIVAPPGRRSVAPQIALSYSSGTALRGGGEAGIGWSVGGFSVITRCPQTVATDSRLHAVDYSLEDRLCLDGQRLMLVKGVYGRSGSEYRTEIESFNRIILHGNISKVAVTEKLEPSFIEVQSKDGRTSYYGGAWAGDRGALESLSPPFTPSAMGAAMLEAWNAPHAWWIRLSHDPQGNSIAYDYVNRDGEFLPEKIEYTGILSPSDPKSERRGNRRIRFEFEPRPDPDVRMRVVLSDFTLVPDSLPPPSLFPSLPLAETRRHRLKTIVSEVARDVVRRYELRYAESRATKRSLLSSVTECAGTPCTDVNRLPPTRFTYQDAPAAYTEVRLAEGEDVWVSLLSDFDGDGTRDTERMTRDCHVQSRWTEDYVRLSGGGTMNVLNEPWKEWLDRAWNVRSRSDFDLDGASDILGVVDGRFAFVSRGQVKTTSLELDDTDFLVDAADFDGNGQTDLLIDRGSSGVGRHLSAILQCTAAAATTLSFCDEVPVPLGSNPASRVSVRVIGDVDGNGRPDLFVDWNGVGRKPSNETPPVIIRPAIVFALQDPTSPERISLRFEAAPLFERGGPVASFREEENGGLADLNGDGLIDVFSFSKVANDTYTPAVWINGGGLFRQAQVTGLTQLGIENHHVGLVSAFDQDADGRAEILIPGELRVPWCYEESSGTEPKEYCAGLSGAHNITANAVARASDRSIYRWDALDFVDDGQGGFILERRPTPIEAPLQGTSPEDFFGDGLTDLRIELRRTFHIVPPIDGGGGGGGGGGGVGSHDRGVCTPSYPVGYWRGNPGYGVKVLKNRGVVPDLLIQSDDGLSVTSTWSYRSLSSQGVSSCSNKLYENHGRAAVDAHHYLFTSSMNVVARFESSNGLGDRNGRCYLYEDAMANNEGRGFLGFRKITEFEDVKPGVPGSKPSDQAGSLANNLRTTTTYAQQFPLVGVPIDVSTYLADDDASWKPFKRVTHRWSSRCEADADAASSGQVCVNRLDEAIEEVRDVALSRDWISTKATTYTYLVDDEAYGNVSIERTEFLDKFQGQIVEKRNTYDYSSAHQWWIDQRVRQEIEFEPVAYRGQHAIVGLRENNQKILTTQTDYYPDDGSPTSRQPRSEVVQDGNATERHEVDFDRYDRFGNLLTQTMERAGRQPRTTRYGYTDDGYFLTYVRNPLGHERFFETDRRSGTVTRTIDRKSTTAGASSAASVEASSILDAFGRVVERHATGTTPVYQRTAWCRRGPDCPPEAKFKVTEMGVGQPTHTQFFDALGRIVQETETGFDAPGVPARDIVVVTQYDRRGHVIAKSEPSEVPGGAYFTRFKNFDALGRPGRKEVDKAGYTDAQGGPDESFVTAYTYNGLTTEIVLDGALRASRTVDGLGRLIETVDTMGSPTHYRYDGQGHLILIEDSAGNQTRAEYDNIGRKISSSDPNRGDWHFKYNAFGELVSLTDANRNLIEYVRDPLGRIVERHVGHKLDAAWFYDTVGNGLLAKEVAYDRDTGDERFARTFAYDAMYRPHQETESFDGETFTTETAYTCTGEVLGVKYPNGEYLKFEYTPSGYLRTEKDPAPYDSLMVARPEVTYREVLAQSPRGQPLLEAFGNGLFGKTEVFESTGQVRAMCVGVDAVCSQDRQWLEYGYHDPFGNLTDQRKKLNDVSRPQGWVRETFEYDALQRLRTSTRRWSGPNDDGSRWETSDRYAYDALGNILSKSDFGENYRYGDGTRSNRAHAGPHAVLSFERVWSSTVAPPTRVTVDDFRYDGNGNLVVGDGRTIQYSIFNTPLEILEGDTTTTFAYDPNGQRYKQTTQSPRFGRTILRVRDGYEKVTEQPPPWVGTQPKPVEKVYAGSSVVVERRRSGARTLKWLHKDRLGSVETVTDKGGRPTASSASGQGEVVEIHGYDPFGLPRSGQWESGSGRLQGHYESAATTRGFTGQEHLDAHRLIHLNGRVYDPGLGRFLSVDPIIADPANAQSLNAYSYVLNNPLSFIDPSGYLACEVSANARLSCNYDWLKDGAISSAKDADGIAVTFSDAESGSQLVMRAENGHVGFALDGSSIEPSDIGSPYREAFQTSTDPLNVAQRVEQRHTFVGDTVKKVQDAAPTENEMKGLIIAAGAIGALPAVLNLAIGSGFALAATEITAAEAAGVETAAIGAGSAGARIAAAAGGAGRATVSLDTNALIAAVERGQSILGGRAPVVPITVAKEFLRGGGSSAALREFLTANGGRIGLAGSEAAAAGLRQQAAGLGRALQLGDSRVAAGAMREGMPLITNDRKFGNFLRAIGYPVEGF